MTHCHLLPTPTPLSHQLARSLTLALALAATLLAGCGSPSTEAASEALGDRSRPASDGCPLTPQALAAATSLRWELKERRDAYPLETAESIKATVCLYTAADTPQEGSDPLTMRVDLVEGADSAAVRKSFTDTCVENGGSVRDSSGAKACKRNGLVVEGLAGPGNRAIHVYWVNADASTATELTPAFDRILAAVAGG